MHYMKWHCIPIYLANGSVLYSEKIGSVRFIPEVNVCKMAPLEFTNVLYVPSLSINLFSVLYLKMHQHFTVSIEQDTLHFIRGGHIIFQANVTPLAYLRCTCYLLVTCFISSTFDYCLCVLPACFSALLDFSQT